MNGFYITVSNGLLTKEHRDRIGTAVWEFMWCLDKITKIDDKGVGYILGGMPIKLSKIANQMGICEDTVSRNLARLKDEKYITILRTPYGLVIKVMKAKKRFYKNAVSLERDSTKMSNPSAKMSNLNRKNVESNKTVAVDSNSKTVGEQSSQVESDTKFSKLGAEVIKLFTDHVNPACSRYYNNTTQRKAADKLIEIHGFPRIEAITKETIPKTNKIEYLPTITTPLQLLERYSALEAGIYKLKGKQSSNNIAFT